MYFGEITIMRTEKDYGLVYVKNKIIDFFLSSCFITKQ